MPKKLSEIAKKMATSILRNKEPSPEALSIALEMTHIAWNYADVDYKKEPGYVHGVQEIHKMIPPVKNEFVMDGVERLIDRLMKYKKKHYRGDKRTIFSVEHDDDKIKVAWLQQ